MSFVHVSPICTGMVRCEKGQHMAPWLCVAETKGQPGERGGKGQPCAPKWRKDRRTAVTSLLSNAFIELSIGRPITSNRCCKR